MAFPMFFRGINPYFGLNFSAKRLPSPPSIVYLCKEMTSEISSTELKSMTGIMNPKVLLIDDDKELAELLAEFFAGNDIGLVSASNRDQGMKLLSREDPDCVLLDVMLPGEDGFSVCKAIRKFSNVPIIMLTARGELADRIIGLKLGADDYLPKPFEPGELVARVQAIVRRRTLFSDGSLLHSGDLNVDLQRRLARRGESEIELTPVEFDTLVIFIRNAGKVLSRDALIKLLGEAKWQSNYRSVDVIVSRLRQKLGDDSHNPRYLKTLRMVGYLFLRPKEDAHPN